MDYPAGLNTGLHAHPRAQLIYAASGVMRIDTHGAAYVVPPSTALLVPAETPHSVQMEGMVAMRALFLREDAAVRAGTGTAVIAVSALLREVILAACAEPRRESIQNPGGIWCVGQVSDSLAQIYGTDTSGACSVRSQTHHPAGGLARQT